MAANRILRPTTAEASIIKKSLQALYNIRSAIVHGGYEILHPMNDDALDKRVNAAFGSFWPHVDYGYALILAAFQFMAEKSWPQLSFEESVLPKENGSTVK